MTNTPMKFKTIFVDRAVKQNPEWSDLAKTIAFQYEGASIVGVDSHWKIPQLHNMDPSTWMKTKRDYLVIGVKKTLKQQKNGRSSDYIAASHANGCASGCSYCYVARRKGGSNPLTTFVNVKEIIESIETHQAKLGPKTEPNQCDPDYWTYDIGNNNDCSIDALISPVPVKLVSAFSRMAYAKATFATKTVNEEAWLSVEPRDSNGVPRTRIRYSLMPSRISKLVDVNTSPIDARIESINRLVEHGYEVHVNFSPVIVYDGWKKDWYDLWCKLDKILTPESKKQLKCEVIFLTHSVALHELNMKWHPKGESLIWQPDIQQTKYNKPDVICYNYDLKRELVGRFTNGIRKYLPYCQVRYAF